MRKNIVVITSVIVMLFIVSVCIVSAQWPRRQIREIEKMTTGQQPSQQKSRAASTLPMKGVGCWVQKTSLDNPNIYSGVFGWYIVDLSIMPFDNKKNNPLFISFAGKNADELIRGMEKYKDKIAGAVWDWEFKGMSQDIAEASLKKAYSRAKELGLLFGLVISPGVQSNIRHGVDLKRADTFSDFIMPMMYAQRPEFGMKRGILERLIKNEREVTRLPIIVLMAIESTKPQPKKIAPGEIVSIYKGLPVDGFAVWNVKDLDDQYTRALSNLD